MQNFRKIPRVDSKNNAYKTFGQYFGKILQFQANSTFSKTLILATYRLLKPWNISKKSVEWVLGPIWDKIPCFRANKNFMCTFAFVCALKMLFFLRFVISSKSTFIINTGKGDSDTVAWLIDTATPTSDRCLFDTYRESFL